MARFIMKVENPKYMTRERYFSSLREAQSAASYTLYDNGVADKRTAQTVAAGLKLDEPGGHGGYTFTITKPAPPADLPEYPNRAGQVVTDEAGKIGIITQPERIRGVYKGDVTVMWAGANYETLHKPTELTRVEIAIV